MIYCVFLFFKFLTLLKFIKTNYIVFIMRSVIKKEILFDLSRAIEIFDKNLSFDELRKLSDHSIEDVALHKDLDMISITVLIYSLFKISNQLTPESKQKILNDLNFSYDALKDGNLGKYNSAVKRLFLDVREFNASIKEHLADVMQAGKIKKGQALLERGLSLGQAAGLMGLSNWDLQAYASKTVALSEHTESYPAKKRMVYAMEIFGI